MGLLAVRFLLAAVFFELLRLFKIIKVNLNKEKVKKLLVIALLQPVLYFIFETYGLFYSTSGEAAITISLIPLFVTILSAVLLKEKASKGQVFFITLSVIGVMIVQISNHKISTNSNIWGFILLLGGAISASLYNIFARKSANKIKPLEVTYFMMLLSAISFNLIYFLKLLINDNLNNYFTVFLNINLIIPVLYLGIISSILAFFLVNYSLKILPAHISAVYTNLSTVVTLVSGYFILNEKLSVFHIIGALIIIIGVYGTMYLNGKSKINQIQI